MANEKIDAAKNRQEAIVTVIETIEDEKITSQLDFTGTSKVEANISVTSLRQLPSTVSDGTDIESQRPAIPATDKSRAAWIVLIGVILTQGMLFAFPLTFGVFQDYFSEHQRLSNSAHSIWIGVLSTGVPFIGAPFVTALCENRPAVRWRYFVIVGWAVCTLSLIGAAFAKRLLVLGMTQGVLYGVGLMILDVPALLILNTWFVERRGWAYGLLFGITDLAGFAATILAGQLLRDHGLKRTMLTFAGILLIISGPCIWLLRYRPAAIPAITAVTEVSAPEIEIASTQPVADVTVSDAVAQPIVRYYRCPTFYIFAFANLFHALAYYLPFLYLPTYAVELGLSNKRGAWLLAGANFAQVFGEVFFGGMSDSFNIHVLVLACTLVSSVSALSLWGWASSFTMLAFFALLFGAFGSGLIALWARMGTYFDHSDALMIFSIMSFGRGFASILSGPISSALETVAAERDATSRYGNGKYLGIVCFTGASMGLSAAIAIIGLVLTWRRQKAGLVT